MSAFIPPLVVENLSKDYVQSNQPHRVLNQFSLTAQQGEFIAIMGPSGSGKSTCLHLVAGLASPTEGKIEIDGDDISHFSDQKLTALRRTKIGFIFQSFNLISTLSVQDNILLPMLSAGLTPDMNRLLSIVNHLGIADKLNRYPHSLSGGEQQRVAIARALLPQPSIILADEPTGSLDTVSGQQLCKLLVQFCKDESCTILMVTHEPSVAMWAHKTLVLRDGKLIKTLINKDFHNVHDFASAYQDILNISIMEV